MTDEITQQTLLPGVKDPNLWMVKCLQGTEKETCLKLMQKFISLEHSEDPALEPLQIRYTQLKSQNNIKINAVGFQIPDIQILDFIIAGSL